MGVSRVETGVPHLTVLSRVEVHSSETFHYRRGSLVKSWFHWKQTPQISEQRPMPRVLCSSYGLQGATDKNQGAVAIPPHTGCSFLPFPSEHCRQTDLLFSPSLK